VRYVTLIPQTPGSSNGSEPCDSQGIFLLSFFCGEGAPQLMLRTHRSLKAYCATPVMKMRMSSFLPSFTSNGAPVEWNWQGKTDNSEENLSQCHFVHHKSHMDLAWDRTRASVVRGRRLTAWAMARPVHMAYYARELHIINIHKHCITWCALTGNI
jgi:hypothetical protein